MDLHTLLTVAGWARLLPVLCLLALSRPCPGADGAEGDAAPERTAPPTVKVDHLLNRLYPNQSELIGSLSATTTTLEATASPVNRGGKAAGALIVHGRKPILPPIAVEGEGTPTSTTAGMEAATQDQSTAISRLKRDFLSTDLLRQLRQAGVMPPNVPMSLPSGLNLAALLAPAAPADQAGMTTHAGSAASPRVPLPDKTSLELSSQSLSASRAEAIDINQADADEIMKKLGLDARRARLVLQFRTLYGPFKTPEDLAQVNGLNDELVRNWEDADLLRF